MAITQENTEYVTGTSFSFDIGAAGNDRLVVIAVGDESDGVNLSDVTVDGKSCTHVVTADNSADTTGNHQEVWYITESDLGASNGSVTVAITGGDSGWGIRAHLYYGYENELAPTEYGVDDTAVSVASVSVDNITNAADDLIFMTACHGGSTAWDDTAVTSPLSSATAPGLGDPSSAVMETYDAVESSANTDKTYSAEITSGTFNRGTGIVVVFPASSAGGETVMPIFLHHYKMVGGL
jgi:hypothetical protein